MATIACARRLRRQSTSHNIIFWVWNITWKSYSFVLIFNTPFFINSIPAVLNIFVNIILLWIRRVSDYTSINLKLIYFDYWNWFIKLKKQRFILSFLGFGVMYVTSTLSHCHECVAQKFFWQIVKLTLLAMYSAKHEMS